MEQRVSQNSANPESRSRKGLLSTLWLFVSLNYIFCDVLGVMDPELVPPVELTQGFLLGAGILLEIPIAMVLLSRVLPYNWNRRVNIIAAVIMTVIQVASLFLGANTLYYIFFSIIEVTTTAFIVWAAWNWRDMETAVLNPLRG